MPSFAELVKQIEDWGVPAPPLQQTRQGRYPVVGDVYGLATQHGKALGGYVLDRKQVTGEKENLYHPPLKIRELVEHAIPGASAKPWIFINQGGLKEKGATQGPTVRHELVHAILTDRGIEKNPDIPAGIFTSQKYAMASGDVRASLKSDNRVVGHPTELPAYTVAYDPSATPSLSPLTVRRYVPEYLNRLRETGHRDAAGELEEVYRKSMDMAGASAAPATLTETARGNLLRFFGSK